MADDLVKHCKALLQPLDFYLELPLNPKKIHRQQLTEAGEEIFEDMIGRLRRHVHLQTVKSEDAVSMYGLQYRGEELVVLTWTTPCGGGILNSQAIQDFELDASVCPLRREVCIIPFI